ncbi:hypothetical protein NL676_032468 [Syzygium grande]|nr:hypothetical protein NL676_032468 [Syzygium grande]
MNPTHRPTHEKTLSARRLVGRAPPVSALAWTAASAELRPPVVTLRRWRVPHIAAPPRQAADICPVTGRGDGGRPKLSDPGGGPDDGSDRARRGAGGRLRPLITPGLPVAIGPAS